MKLYAKISSDRAKKGQGGNKHIEIELYAFNREYPIGIVFMEVLQDADGHLDQYLLTYKEDEEDEAIILKEGHWNEGTIQSIYDNMKRLERETKGNKQKGENL